MALVTNLLEGSASEWALLKRHKCEDVFGIQLAAAHPDQYMRVSELIEKYTDVDFVDLNLGCPLDLLCNKGAGAALMMREHKLKGALQGMSTNLSCSITVKMRTGWDMNKPIAHKLLPKIQSWEIDGLAAVMVSGLTLWTFNSEQYFLKSIGLGLTFFHPGYQRYTADHASRDTGRKPTGITLVWWRVVN
jgi:tRNA-dihydrouridine synthase 3